MSLQISVAAANAAINAVSALIDAGGGVGKLQIRTGAQPANCAAGDSGTLLATPTFSATSFAAASAGSATANAVTSDTNCAATGTAAHFRIKDFANTVIAQGSVTATGGGGDITFDSTSIVAAGTCQITSLTLTHP